MTRAQQYIDALLGHIPTWELTSIDHRNMFDQIKERLATSENFESDIQMLFKVHNLSDFALSLMWIAGKVEADQSLQEPSSDEEKFVFSKFKRVIDEEVTPFLFPGNAFGSLPDSANSETMPSSSGVSFSDELSSFGFNAMDTQEQPSAISQSPEAFGGFLGMEPAPGGPPAAVQHHSADAEQDLAVVLEKFLEAIQSASDDRQALLGQLQEKCRSAITATTDNDCKQISTLLLEFLDYVAANQFIDDIRVMNIISNIQDPFAQWIKTAADQRAGILNPAIEVLRNFKTMFE